MTVLNLHVVIRGVSSADEDRLGTLQDRLEELGAEGVAVAFYPEDEEVGLVFDIEEEKLLGLLESKGDRAAA